MSSFLVINLNSDIHQLLMGIDLLQKNHHQGPSSQMLSFESLHYLPIREILCLLAACYFVCLFFSGGLFFVCV